MQRAVETLRLASALASTTAEITAYTAPLDSKVIINSLLGYNDHTSSVTVKFWLVPYGTTSAVTHKFYEQPVSTKQSIVFQQMPIVLEPGDFIVIQASVANVFSLKLFGTKVQME